MTLDALRTSWDEIASVDPLWAILIEPGRRNGRWPIPEFLHTGEVEIAEVLARVREIGFTLPSERALDFGCGVGRLTRAMSGSFRECVGVDISSRMIELAREINKDRGNCQFSLNTTADLQAFDTGSFDFVYSSLVLQHMPSAELALRYMDEFLRVTRPDGMIVFQLPYTRPWSVRLQAPRRLYSLLRRLRFSERFLHRRLLLHPIQLIAIPEGKVRAHLAISGGDVVDSERDLPPRLLGSVRYYVKHGYPRGGGNGRVGS
jgi:SAM-dependent methyltransferase